MMSEVIRIEDTEMQIKEYNGQRVVTLKDIDAVHGKKTDTAKKSFQKHKKHFVLGKHYFEITRKELGERYSPNEKVIGNPNIITYLFTERGYLMLVKSFADDLSWLVQDRLVEVYFDKKEENTSQQITDNRPQDIEYQTSNTPVPRNKSWYKRNQARVKFLCKETGRSMREMYHQILTRVGAEYDLDEAKKIYKEEKGYLPEYPMDLIDYFPDLGALAEYYLDCLEMIYGSVE